MLLVLGLAAEFLDVVDDLAQGVAALDAVLYLAEDFAELCFGGFFMLQGVEVFQEEQPGGLLGVVELPGAPSILPEDVVDVFEGLFEPKGVRAEGRRRRGKYSQIQTP